MFSMDPKACTWRCQLYAEGKVREFRTEPAPSPVTIFDELDKNKGVFSGANPYLQRPWWQVLFRLFFEMKDWELYLSNRQDLTKLESHELENIGRAYDVWRDRLHEALVEMGKSEDKKLMDEMLDLLKTNRPSPAELNQIQLKFQYLYLRYGYDPK